MMVGTVRDRILIRQGKHEGEEAAKGAADDGDQGARPMGDSSYALVIAIT